MFEFVAILSIIFVGIIIVTLFAAVGFVLKLAFKLVLLPFWILGVVAKVTIGLLLFVGLLVFAPVALTVLLVLALPVALLAGLFGVGWALVA